MLRRLGVNVIIHVLISFVIFYWYINTYSPSPSYLLITDLIEAKSIAQFGSFLNKENLSAITNSIGMARLSLPILVLSALTFLSINSVSLMGINFTLLSLSVFLLWKNTKTPYIFIPIIFLSPVFLQSITSQIATNLLVFLFSVYAFCSDKKVKMAASALAILTAYAAWPIFIFLTLFSFLKNKSKDNLFIFLISLVLVFILFFNTENLISTYFPILFPKTHGYFIDIHRQADLVGGVPFLGKIFYNKYIVILRAIFEEGIKFLDWDYLVFHTATGKFISSPPTFALMSIFELPLLIYSGFLIIKRKISGARYVFAAVFALSIFKYNEQILPIYWISIAYLLIQTWQNVKQKTKRISLIFLPLILISKIILVNHAAVEINSYGSEFKVYKELMEQIRDNEKGILLTDRLGQPHIYLSFFDAISIKDLRDEVATTTRRDANNLVQPDKIEQYTFSSFIFHRNSEEFITAKDMILVELDKNFEEVSGGRSLNEYIKDEKGEELRLHILEL